MKVVNHLAKLLVVYSCLSTSFVFAYTITLPVDVVVTEIDERVSAIQVSCTLRSDETSDYGVASAPVSARAFMGSVTVSIEASQPVERYHDVNCKLALCRANRCDNPLPRDQVPYSHHNDMQIAYDPQQPHLIEQQQSIADSLLFEAMPMPPVMARTRSEGETSSPKTLTGNSTGSKSSATVASLNAQKTTSASKQADGNSGTKAGAMAAAMERYGFSDEEKAFVGSDKKKLEDLLAIRAANSAQGSSEETEDEAIGEYIKAGGGDIGKNRAGLVLVAEMTDKDADKLIASGLKAKDVMRLVAASQSMGLGESAQDEVVDEAIKDGDTKGASLIIVSNATGMDIGEARKYGSAKKAMEAWKFIRLTGSDDEALSNPEFTDAFTSFQNGKISKNELATKLNGMGVISDRLAGDITGSGGTGTGSGNNQPAGGTGSGNVAGNVAGNGAAGVQVVGTGAGKEVALVIGGTGKGKGPGGGTGTGTGSGSGSRPGAGSAPNSKPAEQSKNQDLDANDLERIDGGSFDEAPAEQQEDQGPTYVTIDSRSEDSSTGTVTVTYTYENPDGTTVTVTTEHYPDNTMTVKDENGNVIKDKVPDPAGAPPEGSEGSTGLVDDETGEATFVQEDDDEDDGGSGEDGGDSCEEAGNCGDSEEDSAEEETAETSESETEGDSTPNPRDNDDMSEGLAWALENPDNALAQQMLATAAQSIQDLSGTCQAGCPDATEKGGLLWAMLNPTNPLAQQILADAAEAIQNNSGAGQAGGADDNPANEPVGGQVSDSDLRRIEYLLSGGGVTDPPEETGSGAPPGAGNGLGGSSPIVGGAGPVSGSDLEIHGKTIDGNNGGSGDPNDPEDQGEIQIDTGRLNSGGLR